MFLDKLMDILNKDTKELTLDEILIINANILEETRELLEQCNEVIKKSRFFTIDKINEDDILCKFYRDNQYYFCKYNDIHKLNINDLLCVIDHKDNFEEEINMIIL